MFPHNCGGSHNSFHAIFFLTSPIHTSTAVLKKENVILRKISFNSSKKIHSFIPNFGICNDCMVDVSAVLPLFFQINQNSSIKAYANLHQIKSSLGSISFFLIFNEFSLFSPNRDNQGGKGAFSVSKIPLLCRRL